MIREYEEALARGEGAEGLERIRQGLIQRAEDDRRERMQQIETDYKSVQLIRFGLDQDRASPAFAIAKGYCRWLQKKHPASDDDKLAASLMREVRREEYESKAKTKRKEATNNDTAEGTCSEVTVRPDRESSGEQAEVPTGVSSSES